MPYILNNIQNFICRVKQFYLEYDVQKWIMSGSLEYETQKLVTVWYTNLITDTI